MEMRNILHNKLEEGKQESFAASTSRSGSQHKKRRKSSKSKEKGTDDKKKEKEKKKKATVEEVEPYESPTRSQLTNLTEKGAWSVHLKDPRMKVIVSVAQLLSMLPNLALFIALKDIAQDKLIELEAQEDGASPTQSAWLTAQVGLTWTCIAQVISGFVMMTVVALLTSYIHHKRFVIIHVVPFMQAFALFGLVPLFSLSSQVLDQVRLGDSNLTQFFIAMAVTIIFYFGRVYQFIASAIFVITYFVIGYNLPGLFQLDQSNSDELTLTHDEITEKIQGLHSLRLLSQISSSICISAYFYILWLVSSTGQPTRSVARDSLLMEQACQDNYEDIINLLELETDPYVVFRMTRPLKHSHQENIFDKQFVVQFVSLTFKKHFLQNRLLVSQGMKNLNPNDPTLTKAYGKNNLIVEDLIFRRMNQATMAEYYDQWVSGEDDDEVGEDINDAASSVMQPRLVTLKQLADAWEDPADLVRKANLMWANPGKKLSPEQLKAVSVKTEKVYEILSRESIRREQVFSGYHQLDDVNQNRVQNFENLLNRSNNKKKASSDCNSGSSEEEEDIEKLQMELDMSANSPSNMSKKRRNNIQGLSRDGHWKESSQLMNNGGASNRLSVDSKNAFSDKKTVYEQEIARMKRKQQDLDDKVFVQVSFEEILKHGTIYRILKFKRIRKTQTLKKLVFEKKSNKANAVETTNNQANADLNSDLPAIFQDDGDAFMPMIDPNVVSAQLTWIRDHSRILESQRKLLQLNLETLLYYQKGGGSELNGGRMLSGRVASGGVDCNNSNDIVLRHQSSKFQNADEEFHKAKQSSNNQLQNQQKVTNMDEGSSSNLQQLDKKNMFKTVFESIDLLKGLQIEQLTQSLCTHIFQGNRDGFFSELMMTTKNPYEVALGVIRRLKQNFNQKHIIVSLMPSKDLPTELQYDWDIFSCILWNALLVGINGFGAGRLLLVELGIVKRVAPKVSKSSMKQRRESPVRLIQFEESKGSQKDTGDDEDVKSFLIIKVLTQKKLERKSSIKTKHWRQKQVRTLMHAAKYLSKACNGNFESFFIKDVCTQLIMLPTKISPQLDKLKAKQNLFDCLEKVYDDLKDDKISKRFSKCEKSLTKHGNILKIDTTSMAHTPSYILYVGKDGVEKCELFSKNSAASKQSNNFFPGYQFLSKDRRRNSETLIKNNSQQRQLRKSSKSIIVEEDLRGSFSSAPDKDDGQGFGRSQSGSVGSSASSLSGFEQQDYNDGIDDKLILGDINNEEGAIQPRRSSSLGVIRNPSKDILGSGDSDRKSNSSKMRKPSLTAQSKIYQDPQKRESSKKPLSEKVEEESKQNEEESKKDLPKGQSLEDAQKIKKVLRKEYALPKAFNKNPRSSTKKVDNKPSSIIVESSLEQHMSYEKSIDNRKSHGLKRSDHDKIRQARKEALKLNQFAAEENKDISVGSPSMNGNNLSQKLNIPGLEINIVDSKESQRGKASPKNGIDGSLQPNLRLSNVAPIADRNKFIQKLEQQKMKKSQIQAAKPSSSSSSSSSSSEEDGDETPFTDKRKNVGPRPSFSQAPPPAPVKKDGSCSCNATILVVEDNFYNVIPLKMLLKATYNQTIERAENGKVGVEIYKRNATQTCCKNYFQLVFMDINMPVMNGYDATTAIFKLYEELQAQPEYAHLKRPAIFAMTAQQNQETLRNCVDVGMNGIVYKPVNKKGLEAHLGKFFNENR